MKFKKISDIVLATQVGVIYLIYSNWDDYDYRTTFHVYYRTSSLLEDIGVVKIGCKSLARRAAPKPKGNGYNFYSIENLIETEFESLEEDFFSLGQDIDYYKNINRIFLDGSEEYYQSLKDLAFNFNIFRDLNRSESCINTSLMRDLHIANVEQFCRIARGESELTEYSLVLKYVDEAISIKVLPNSLPPSNIHVLIGRNGVGKTFILHNIVCRLLENEGISVYKKTNQKYRTTDNFYIQDAEDNFAGIIGLSFSAFDDALYINFEKPNDVKIDSTEYEKLNDDFNKKYKYIGLINKNKDDETKIKSVADLSKEFIIALSSIKKSKRKKDIYLKTCENLNTDPMFCENGFIELISTYFTKEDDELQSDVIDFFKKLSSGHMIIILSLTLLAECIYEKTIVLVDEPETHLHPPLLSTYIRTLSFLLTKMNAIAIIATHSPIVLQEVPSYCVNRIDRIGSDMSFNNLEIETFATNVDTLTREVFGLEVIKTGFYNLIEKELGTDFDESYNKFENNVGYLGQILMQSLLHKRELSNEKD